jgi:hypothetical protein
MLSRPTPRTPCDRPEADAAVGGVAPAELREDERAERPADQAADVAADRDARDREAEHEVDHHERERGTAEHVVALPLENECGAEDPEDRARGADRRGGWRVHERACRSGQPGDDVDEQEAAPPERLLDGRADEPEEVHVERDVQDACVQEGAGDQAPPVAVRDRRAEEYPLREQRPAGRVEPLPCAAGDDVDGDVESDERLRDQRTGPLEDSPPGPFLMRCTPCGCPECSGQR